MDGAHLQGIGSILMGVASIIGAMFAIYKSPEIIDSLKSHKILKFERDQARLEVTQERRRAESAEQWAKNADGAADRADREVSELSSRLERIESKLEAFDRLCEYTRNLLLWAITAEHHLRETGVVMAPYPPVPPELAAALRDAPEVV